MKKLFFMGLLLAAMTGLSTTAVYADPWAKEAVCDPAISQIQKDMSEYQRALQKAYSRQYIKRPRSGLELTCFDQAMKLTARLGAMFSDNHSRAPAPSLVGSMKYPDFGAGKMLGDELNRMVGPGLGSMMKNFSGTLAQVMNLSLASVGGALGDVMADIKAAVADINTAFAGAVTQVTEILAYMNEIKRLATALGAGTTAFGNLLSIAIAIINGLLKSAQKAMRIAMRNYQMVMNFKLGNIMNTLFSKLLGPATDMDCGNMLKAWNDKASGSVPIIGGGIALGTPYMALHTGLNNVVAWSAMGDKIQKSMSGITSGNAKNKIRESLKILKSPGQVPSWRAPATLNFNLSSKSLVKGM